MEDMRFLGWRQWIILVIAIDRVSSFSHAGFPSPDFHREDKRARSYLHMQWVVLKVRTPVFKETVF